MATQLIMAPTCSEDPLVCIDFLVLFISEFLKDWTTMGMLAILLVLLLRLRDAQQEARKEAYAKQMEAFDDNRRSVTGSTKSWIVEDGVWVER